MPNPTIKTRFAPSPTGYLHLGNVRTALFNALLARRHGGTFLLRSEDTDTTRSGYEYFEALLEDLEWLGLDWDEGPGREQAGHGPYHQSERGDIYAHYYALLEEKGLVYPCFATEQELKMIRKAQLAAGQPPRYPGTYRDISDEERERLLAEGRKPTLRFRVPEGREIVFDDLVQGEKRFRTDEIGDFIIRRADGTPSFFFTNALDDALMGVTHVLRGEDHLTNTPRQLLLLEAMGLEAPTYGHTALIVGDDGAPLSKRNGSASIRELREQGFMPNAVNNHLARLGHHYEDEGSYKPLAALAEGFAVDRLGRAPARHDAEHLRHWQKEAVLASDTARLEEWMGERVAHLVPADRRERFVEVIRENSVFPADAEAWAEILFVGETPFSEAAVEEIRGVSPEFFHALLEGLEEDAGFRELGAALKDATGLKGRKLFMPLRAALTGRTDGPQLGDVLDLVDAECARARVQQARRLNTAEDA